MPLQLQQHQRLQRRGGLGVDGAAFLSAWLPTVPRQAGGEGVLPHDSMFTEMASSSEVPPTGLAALS